MASTLTISPGNTCTFPAVTLGTGSETSYVLIATIQPGGPGLLVIQGDVGSGNALGGLKFARAVTKGGTDVTLSSDASIETAGLARGFVDVVGDGTHSLYQTALSSSFQATLLWLGGGDLNIYAKRADSSATTTLTISATMQPPPVDNPQNGASTTITGTMTIGAAGTLTFSDGGNLVAGTSTGTKIGTGATQKLGFWNATPVVQPVGANQAALTDNSGGAAAFTLAVVTAPSALTDSTGGSASTTLAAITAGAAYAQADATATKNAIASLAARQAENRAALVSLTNAVASLARQGNQVRGDLTTVGLIKGAA